MNIEQIYTGCLAQGAYFIESAGEAGIIDPLRDLNAYLKKAEEENVKIKYILETHFHADFVSGHLDLAQKTGATIVYGPGAKTDFEKHEARDGEVLKLGDISIEVIHTPGHTLESTCYLLRDENGKPHALFTGDTVFIGDVGRPDLAQKGMDLTQEDLAGMLYDSIREKVFPLPDDVVIYPAHGAGSACGKNMSKETWDTLGHQKEVNYALREDMGREEFIGEVTAGILPPPQYFAKNAKLNQTGYKSLDDILQRGKVALDPETFESMANHEGALVLDTRHQDKFVEEHIPNSIFIGLNGNFAPWVGALIPDLEQPIIFVCDEGKEDEVITRLSRVGYDHTLGFLRGGIAAWKAAGKEIASIPSVPTEEFAAAYEKGNCNVLDVRKPGEYETGHLHVAQSVPLDFINEEMDEVDPEKEYFVHCAGGYRSVIFTSILKSRGFDKLIDVKGGYKAIEELKLPVTE